MPDRRFWLGFNLVAGIGPARFRRLLAHFGSAEVAWKANGRDLALAGLDLRTIESIIGTRERLDLDRELARVEGAGATLLIQDDELYPPLLRQISDAPPLLYIRGQLRAGDELSIAVVGTRRASIYGKHVCERLVTEIAGRGVTVVSGLARGIDAVAHRVALAAGGRTIAVVGCGVDVIYPPEHAALARDIVNNGAIISEYALGSSPEAGN
ncbi:MAG TPA: DNA-processing protein DprA, partial [Chloroflexota bacterium]|nr:DNA-processing protein DprA [Chloroflexota bacterium]